MYLEEIQVMIKNVQQRIETTKREIRKKEQDYEDLLQVKAGLERVNAAFQEKKLQNRTVFQNPNFSRNRCMQRLRENMTDHLSESSAGKHQNSVSTGIESIRRKMRTVLGEIDSKEQALGSLLSELDVYKAQAINAVSINETEE